MNEWLNGLNERQLEAVQINDKPLLILAGAGTGKTKTVVAKIGNLISSGLARPDQIMGLTFTNKAAREMKERLLVMQGTENLWLGTFHSVCVRLLRMYHQEASLDRNFIIADQEESHKIIKNLIKEFFPEANNAQTHKAVASAISKLKEKGITHDSNQVPPKDIFGVQLDKAYTIYQQDLKRSNLLDFDDIIITTTKLLKNSPATAQRIHDKLKYLFVDEYQDTSVGQNELIKSLCGPQTIICCVGDEDQSIYSWRGASIDNILTFEKNFPNAAVVTLEKNYRSTTSIVDFASSLIRQNKSRYNKNIQAVMGAGVKAKIASFSDSRSEANYVAQEVQKIRQSGGALNNIAVLVRASFQNKSFEEAFNSYGIPYRIVDGIKFFERKEVKDIIAYLRLCFSQKDEISFDRVINVPKRGLGEKTVESILSRCRSTGSSPIQILKEMLNNNEFRQTQTPCVIEFVQQIEGWGRDAETETKPISKIAEEIAHQTNYIQMLKDAVETDPDAEERISNIYALINDLGEFDSLANFLEFVALASQRDSDSESDAVNVMTIHGAKGLEFETVFCPGWEEGVFPSSKSLELNLDSAVEEERRLGYVAITRAKKSVTVLFANSRFTFGSWRQNPPSRFVAELRKNAPEESFEQLYLHNGDDGEDEAEEASFGRSQWRGGKRAIVHGGNRWGPKRPIVNSNNWGSEKKRSSVSSVSPSSFSLQETKNEAMPLAVGGQITHATFGVGKIEKLLGNYAEVVFNDSEGKRLIHRNFIKPLKE